MALNGTHNLDTIFMSAYSPSVGATPVSAYVAAPMKGRLLGVDCTLGGALTTADATVTVTNMTTGVTWGTLTLTQSGSAAGSFFTSIPSTYASSLVSLNDVFSVTPASASGASIPGHFRLSFRSF